MVACGFCQGGSPPSQGGLSPLLAKDSLELASPVLFGLQLYPHPIPLSRWVSLARLAA